MAADVGVGAAEPERTVRIVVEVPFGRWRTVTLAAAALAAAQLIWFAVELLRGYFWQDDFVFLYLAGTEPLGELLLREHNGHLQPGAFVLSWLVAQQGPLNWAAAVLPLVVLHGAALLLWWLFLVRLYGERWVLLVPFVVVAFSPLTFGLSLWWAYALQLLPMQVALFGALHAHVGYLQEPSRWRAARTALFVVFGMAFGEKAALIPLVLLGVTLALTEGGLRARVVTTVRRHRLLLLGYVALLAGYVALHLWRSPLPGGYTPSVRELFSLTRSMIADGLVPALFGGPWSGDWVGLRGLAPPDPAVLAVSWTLFAGLVLAGLWLGRTRAALAWLTLLGYLVASVLLLAMARLGAWGTLIGTDRRNVGDALLIAVVCAVLAVLRPRGAPAVRWPLHRPASGDRARTVVPLVLSAVLVAGAAASIVGALPEHRHQAARDYVGSVAAAKRLQPDLVLYDFAVPSDVMLPLFGEYAMASRALHGLGLRFDQPTSDLRMLDDTGTPRKIGLVSTVTNRTPPVAGCGYLIGPNVTRVELTDRADDGRLAIQLAYFTQDATDGTVATPTSESKVRFEPGLNLVSLVAHGPFSEVLVRADGAVCLTEAVVGLPLPIPN